MPLLLTNGVERHTIKSLLFPQSILTRHSTNNVGYERNPASDPGGALEAPEKSTVPLLDLSIRPRMNFYLDEDDTASVIVDAFVSQILNFFAEWALSLTFKFTGGNRSHTRKANRGTRPISRMVMYLYFGPVTILLRMQIN